jgi:subtilisin family serine protease
MKRFLLAACLASVLPAQAANPPGWSDAALRRIEPICVRLWEEGAAGSFTEVSFPHDSPVRAPQVELLAQGRLRLQLDSGPEGGPAATLRTACLSRVPSLDWEGARGSIAQVTLAIADLPLLADVPGLFYAMRPPAGVALVTSAGVGEIGAGDYLAGGLDGTGIRIGILDLGFEGLESVRGTELPADLRTRAFAGDPAGSGDLDNGTSHGVACAELVHDVAPGASLYLANANTDIELEAAVGWMIEQGVSVISYSVGWFYGPGDGTGRLQEIVDQALDAGSLWVNASGNQAQAHWGGSFTDTDLDGLHEFEATDETISFAPREGGDSFVLTLTWDSWPYSTNLAFDIEIYQDGLLSASTNTGAPSGLAYRDIEYVRGSPGSTIDVSIRRTQGTRGARLSLFRADGEALAEHRVPEGSLLIPADGARVLAVGAYRLGTGRLEEFSSRGPTLDGRVKPELCGPDGISTATYPVFHGTSAACPHAAGAAALLLSAAPPGGFFDFHWTPEELRHLFAAGAEPADFGDPNACLWGRLKLLPLETTRNEGAPLGLRVASPTRAPTRLAFTAPSATPAALRIFDAAGRLIRDERVRAGDWVWDGLDRQGRPCPGGVYILHLSAASGRRVRRLVLLP